MKSEYSVRHTSEAGWQSFEPPSSRLITGCSFHAYPRASSDSSTRRRRGEVRRLYPDGRFQVCIHTRCGVPDEDFIEWYARQDEGREWRRIASAPAPPPG